jgi:hypothetical protein
MHNSNNAEDWFNVKAILQRHLFPYLKPDGDAIFLRKKKHNARIYTYFYQLVNSKYSLIRNNLYHQVCSLQTTIFHPFLSF